MDIIGFEREEAEAGVEHRLRVRGGALRTADLHTSADGAEGVHVHVQAEDEAHRYPAIGGLL
jgi:hypothetical protein